MKTGRISLKVSSTLKEMLNAKVEKGNEKSLSAYITRLIREDLLK